MHTGPHTVSEALQVHVPPGAGQEPAPMPQLSGALQQVPFGMQAAPHRYVPGLHWQVEPGVGQESPAAQSELPQHRPRRMQAPVAGQ